MASANEFLWAPVNTDDWTVNTKPTPNNTSERKIGTTALGKDAFLTLLVAQMQYQDPLNPSSDTEWIAQMAQFSSLEAMQNMGQTMTNTQAFQLVGQYVIVDENATEDGRSGNPSLKAGMVDYVTMQGNKTYISMNGKTYPYETLDSVVSSNYIKTLAGLGSSGEDLSSDDIVKLLQQLLDQSNNKQDTDDSDKEQSSSTDNTNNNTDTTGNNTASGVTA